MGANNSCWLLNKWLGAWPKSVRRTPKRPAKLKAKYGQDDAQLSALANMDTYLFYIGSYVNVTDFSKFNKSNKHGEWRRRSLTAARVIAEGENKWGNAILSLSQLEI